MKSGPDADVPPASPSTGQQKTSNDPFGDIAETWKGAMAPWLAWFWRRRIGHSLASNESWRSCGQGAHAS